MITGKEKEPKRDERGVNQDCNGSHAIERPAARGQ